MKTLVFWGLYWGPPILGTDHIGVQGLGFEVSGLGLGI